MNISNMLDEKVTYFVYSLFAATARLSSEKKKEEQKNLHWKRIGIQNSSVQYSLLIKCQYTAVLTFFGCYSPVL